MKYIAILTAVLTLSTSVILASPALIPLPNQYEATGSDRSYSRIVLKSNFAGFKNTVETCTLQLPKKTDVGTADTATALLEVLFKHSPQETNPEGYKLTIPEKGAATIEASAPSGAFYGFQTLLQLTHNGKVPTCTIIDAPRFSWRGLMLDEARHFMGKDYVLHLLRTMAAHKMNKFHWHLTDDQGWRIEIKKYPYLTSIGAWRGPGTNAPVPKWDENLPLAKKKYGGFYTQADIKEIVAYANSLHIEIMPEIDVPGHAMAIALSYPQVLPKTDKKTGKDVHNLSGNVISVVSDDNYRMLNDIFGEIAALFPSPYIHVGGDEVNVNAWKASPEHREFMEKHNMKNPHQLQNMFMLRLEKMLKAHGKTLMGWNEIMHGGQLSKDTGIMAWISIGAGINAAKHGYPTVMAVGPHNYFDMKYPGHSETGHFWAGIVDTKRAYNWNPLFADQLDAKQQKNILGVHCALWTEFVPDPANADYKLWPRACATAEVGWTQQDKRKWNEFSNRLGRHLNYLDTLKVGYRVKPPQAVMSQGQVTIKSPYEASTTILYTTDGSNPEKGKNYKGESFSSGDASKLRYLTIRPNGRHSKIMKGFIREALLKWNKNTFSKKGKTTLKFDITDTLNHSGNWILDCKYQQGKNATHIHSARILENTQTIATSEGSVISGKNKIAQLRLPVEKITKGKTYTLEIVMEGKGGNDSRGAILFDRSIWTEPATTVTTKVPHHESNTADKAANWVRSDWFWSNRQGKKGDQWTFTFNDAVKVTTIDLPTGKPSSNDDIIVDATIEVSKDGKTFHKTGSFSTGTGKVKFDKPRIIKAIRITLNNDHQTWIIIRDPEMK